MMTTKLSATLLTFLITVPAFSKTVVESEFELKLPRQFQQSLIEEKWKTLTTREFTANWQFPDQQVVSQEIPVHIKGISIDIKSRLEKPALSGSQSALELSSKGLAAELKIAEVMVDHLVERNVGGIIGRFRVQAQCKDIVLNLKSGEGQFAMKVTPNVGSTQAGANVDSVALSWNPGAWVVAGNVQCSGAEGFSDILMNEVTKITNDSASFVEPQKELIKSYVQKYLEGVTFDFSGSRKLVVARPDIEVTMSVQSFQDLGTEGLLAKGTLAVSFTRVAEDSKKVLKLDEGSAVSSSSASLRLPKDFINVVLSEAYKGNTWLHQISSSKLPGFSTIMNSRFVQLFIWPELMNYSKSAKFLFDLYSDKDVQITGKGLQYSVKTTMYAKMQAPKSGSYISFMNFTLPFNSKVTLKLDDGKVQAKFVNPTLGMTGVYDSTYISRYSPSRRFKSATIRDRIIDSLWGQSVSMTLPDIPVAEGLSLQVNKLLTTESSDLVLQLTP
ncbi:hypothetical protein [Bdellovibrio bacteriovorus]|uniref:hypothetical protein n=1 Tax=Bdellovibrio bacteriovorus TaxID=959 RepID=UPI000304B800|nr:hypothetical protein [Bdellovibrio bacteriovorus]